MKGTRFEVDGFKELDKALEKLGDTDSIRKAANSAARDAMRPVLTDARANIPKDSGLTAKSVVLRAYSRRAKLAGAWVGALFGSRSRKLNGTRTKVLERGHIASWLEFGTAKMPPQPWLRPAFDSKIDSILATLKSRLWAHIKRARK